jgi:Protein of unknown function (DUF3102)
MSGADEQFLAEKAGAIRALAKNVVRDVVEIGRHLTEAKGACAHGEWLPWLEREFAWGERTAQRFMQVHDLAKSAKLSDLGSLDISGLYLLAAPSTPAEVRDAAIARADAGEKLSHRQIKEMVDKAAEGQLAPARAQAMRWEAMRREAEIRAEYDGKLVFTPAELRAEIAKATAPLLERNAAFERKLANLPVEIARGNEEELPANPIMGAAMRGRLESAVSGAEFAACAKADEVIRHLARIEIISRDFGPDDRKALAKSLDAYPDLSRLHRAGVFVNSISMGLNRGGKKLRPVR